MNLTFHTPGGIEGESMRIIQQELDEMGIILDPDCADVVRRAIHTTADFDYAKNLIFTPGAASAGAAALRSGTPIVTDTNMARSGINQKACTQFGVERFCYMADPEVAQAAKKHGTTRAVAAVDRWAQEHPHSAAAHVRADGGGQAPSLPGDCGPGWLCERGGEQGGHAGSMPKAGGACHCGYGAQGRLHGGSGHLQRPSLPHL